MVDCLVGISCIFVASYIIASAAGSSNAEAAKEINIALPGGAEMEMVRDYWLAVRSANRFLGITVPEDESWYYNI